jgi:L-lysine 6-oxidase
LEGQEDSHLSAGQQVNYARGINSFVQMVEHWYALAFIRNNNPETNYPYFTETERNNLLFSYKEVGVGQITGNPDDSDTTIPVFYLEKDREKMAGKRDKARLFVDFLEKRAFKAISVTKGGLGLPKSGTRSRR